MIGNADKQQRKKRWKKEARLRFLFPLFLPLFEGEVALEHQARGYGVHRLFALLRVLSVGHEDIVRVHSRAPLVPMLVLLF